MDQSADPKTLQLTSLLQEQNQYRQEVRLFDAHFFRVLLTYVTGVIAAFGWLGSQVLARAGALVDRPVPPGGEPGPQLGEAVSLIFQQLAAGPFFYLFAGFPIITAIMFLMVARDWTSLNEKFNALKAVSHRISLLAGPDTSASGHHMFWLDRGFNIPGRKPRATVEGVLFAFWFLVAMGLSSLILVRIGPYANSRARVTWFVAGGGLGLALGVASVVMALIVFRVRSYREPDTKANGD